VRHRYNTENTEMHSAARHKIRTPKLKNRTRTTAGKEGSFGSSHNKVHHIHVFVKRNPYS